MVMPVKPCPAGSWLEQVVVYHSSNLNAGKQLLCEVQPENLLSLPS